MYLLLLIFCTCGHISNADDISDDDEGKFIDLLPKEDKDAFIETVARRLFTGVKTKDSRYKSDEEVSDETLNQHSEFVHKVLQEESDNLRRNAKIKRTSEEKMESQGDDKNINPVIIQDDDPKDHIDLTLRSKRSKRHGKTSVDDDNVEFIPVKTVYDDENDRITETKSNIKVNEDGNEDTRNKSKERLGELSAAEDIQVRGHKPHLRESRLAKTEDLNLKESPKDATMIVDFEPEGSQENAKNSNENPDKPTTDSIDHIKAETTTVQEVKISAETTDHVESRYKGTVPIYESQKSDNEGGKSSKESIETDETTTVIIETITTAKNVEETSAKNVEEISTKNVEETSADLAQNTTIKQKYLRDNLDDEKLKKEPENRTGEIEKVINNTSEINETKIVRHFDAETSKVDGVIRVLESEVKENEHFDSLSNDTNLKAENKNSTSSEHDEIINSTKNISNQNMSSSPNDSDDNDETVSSPDNTTTTITSTTTTYTIPNNELENQQSLTELSQKHDENVKNDTEIILKQGNETNERDTQSDEPSEDKDGNDESGNIKSTAEDYKSKEEGNYSTTTETDEKNNKKLYVTEEVDSSFIPSDVKNLRSNNPCSDEDVTTKPTKKVKTTKKKKTITDNSQYVTFEKVVLTTTEKNDESSESSTPKYSIYYSKYVPKNDKKHKKDKKDKTKDNIPDDDSQAANIGNNIIAKVLRQRLLLSPEQYERSEEVQSKLLKSKGKIKEYLVYEIPADESPFVRVKPEPAPEPIEQPYYVPVYNYAPSNAYYNAYNRLGPNDNEEITPTVYERDNSYEHVPPKSIENIFKNFRMPDGHRIFKFNTKKKSGEKLNKKKIIHTTNNLVLPFVVKKPKFTEIYFNPDEYVDMDYYFEKADKPAFRVRNNQRPRKRTGKSFFPDSDDEDHPYNAMAKKKVNNHINAVRQMMFQQKEFGFGRPSTSTSKPHVNETKEDIHNPTDDENQPEPDEGDFRSHRIPFKPKQLRARDKSDYVIIISNDKNRNNKPDRISSDYFFGAYHSDGTTHDRMKREDLFGEIRRLQKSLNTKKSVRSGNKELEEKENWKKNSGTIKEILEIGEERDAFVNLKKLEELGLNVMRRKTDEEIQVYVNVLQDMVKMENRALEKFDWLGSTVDILGAVRKLKYLTEHMQVRQVLDPVDIQLLNYVLYLFKISKSSLEGSSKEDTTLKNPKELQRGRLPRNKHRKKVYLSKSMLNRLWFNSRHGTPELSSSEKGSEELEFLAFLDDLKYSLHGLHNSLKHIAIVTQYNNQQWFSNLKLLYLKNPEQKVLLEVLLHIFTSRLLELIEKSAKNGLEDGYLVYVEKEEKEVERTKEEFIFVLKLLKEIKNLNN